MSFRGYQIMDSGDKAVEEWGQSWREKARKLTDDELLKELQIPMGIWKEDIIREALYRLLKNKEL